MKAYKGFNADMTCYGGYQYAEGEEYQTDQAKLCEAGFHACERPLDVFNHYLPGRSVYHDVELDDVSPERRTEDTKVCGKKIKIGARLSIRDLVKAQIKYTKEHTTVEYTDPERATAGYCGAATAGNRGAATAGDCGAATAGYFGAATAGYGGAATAGYFGAATAGNGGAATAGYCGAATAGNGGAATAGDCGAATAGNGGAATAGYRGAATAGYRGAATAGDCGATTAGDCGATTAGEFGAATSRGRSSVRKNGLAVARGNGVSVRGGLGAILVIAEEKSGSYDIDAWKAVLVDGKDIKADTWYKLVNGELIEAETP